MHFLRNAVVPVQRQHAPAVLAVLKTVFMQPTVDGAKVAVDHALAVLEPRYPKVADLLRNAEADVLAYLAFPEEHWRSMSPATPKTSAPPPTPNSATPR